MEKQRLIDANALKVDYEDWCPITGRHFVYISIAQIDSAPTVKSKKPRRGKWETVDCDFHKCSRCGRIHEDASPFCPQCGSLMKNPKK
jgi:uncharacterized paraquat-inducible protein A